MISSVKKYTAALIFVFALWLLIFIKWERLGLPVFSFALPFSRLPSLSDIQENIHWTLQGVPTGYVETVKGFGLFLIFCMTFLGFGRPVLKWVLGEKNFQELNAAEKFSMSFLLGSLGVSLAWLGLGLAGLVHKRAAAVLWTAGIANFLFQSARSGSPRGFFRGVKGCWDQLSILEKTMILLMGAILILGSAHSVRPEDFRDSLLYYVSLAKFYISQGRVVAYPYHIHTYFPQNTEMLFVGAFLFKSEIAAQLLVWGFFSVLITLVAGFLSRFTGVLAALASAYVVLSAPICAGYSVTLKSDIPAAAFILAHYFALILSLNLKSEGNASARRWALLAGIFLGGAVGHKQNALFAGAFSGAAIFAYDFYQRRKTRDAVFLLLPFSLGAAAPYLPWLIRTFWATGSPIYPHLNQFLHLSAVKPWHLEAAAPGMNPALDSMTRWERISDFIRSLSGLNLYNQGTRMRWPEWGPTLPFALLAPFCVKKDFPAGFRIAVLCALCGAGVLMVYSITENYHLPVLIFLVAVPFALHFNRALKSPRPQVFIGATLRLLGLCLHKMLLQSSFWVEVRNCTSNILSGFPSGNSSTSDENMDKVRWLSHLLDAHSADRGGVLFAGTNYIDDMGGRRIGFNSNVDRERIADFASESQDSAGLRARLEKEGFEHLIVSPEGLQSAASLSGGLNVSPAELQIIDEFLRLETVLRFASRDGTLRWYSLRKSKIFDPVRLESSDVQKFPLQSMEHANSLADQKLWAESERVAKMVIQAPVARASKVAAWWTLGNALFAQNKIQEGEFAVGQSVGLASKAFELCNEMGNMHRARNELEKAVEWYQKSVSANPRYAEGYYNLADVYFRMGRTDQAVENYEKSLQLNPERVDVLNDLGSVYYDRGEYSKADPYYLKALEINPQYYKSYGNLSNTAFMRGNLDAAEGYDRKALRINPQYAKAYVDLGNIYLTRKLYGKALEYYGVALKLKPGDKDIKDRISMAGDLSARH